MYAWYINAPFLFLLLTETVRVTQIRQFCQSNYCKMWQSTWRDFLMYLERNLYSWTLSLLLKSGMECSYANIPPPSYSFVMLSILHPYWWGKAHSQIFSHWVPMIHSYRVSLHSEITFIFKHNMKIFAKWQFLQNSSLEGNAHFQVMHCVP